MIEGFDLAAQGFQAASEFDSAEIDSITAQVNALAPRIGVARAAYDRSAGACRAA